MDYPIDYDHYETDEIIDIVEFLNMLERYSIDKHAVDETTLIEKYALFKSIINNKAEEKRIDKAFQQQTNISIYKTMQTLLK
ncbi:MAG: UPF0223 family protein [Bacillota bacterium]